MAISRPFAYNTASITTGVSASFGNLSVGFVSQSYSEGSGLKWYNGPDEELAYIVGTSQPSGGKVSPDGTVGNVRFWRAPSFSFSSLKPLLNNITGQNFADLAAAQTWLNSNGYFLSDNLNVSSILIGGDFTITKPYDVTSNFAVIDNSGSIDTTFNVGAGFNNSISVLLKQPDGKLLVGGPFTSYNATSSNRIARLNTDGTYDTTFNIGTGFDDNPRTLAIQSDGKIIVGGQFTAYNGTSREFLIRLTDSGSIDTTFSIGTGFSTTGFPFASAVQSDGKILIGGNFTSYQGVSRNCITRLTNSGSNDATLSVGTGFTIGGSVGKIVVQPDGKILVGGNFTTYQGTTRNGIARLTNSGSYDTTFNIGTGLDNISQALTLQSDGKILVGGFFTSYNGTPSNYIARLTNSGSYDTTFNIGTSFNNTVALITEQSDGKIIVGGSFTSYNGTSSPRLARLTDSGSYDTTYNVGTGFNSDPQFHQMLSNGSSAFAGNMSLYKYTINNRFLKIKSSDFTLDSTFNSGNGFNSKVLSLAMQSDGKIVASGYFTSYNGTSSNYIARLNTDGTYDTTFSIGTGFDNWVTNIRIQPDGKILCGGNFTLYNGTTRNRIARLNTDGTYDTTFSIGTGFDFDTNNISLQSDGKIVCVGPFSSYQGTTRNGIARLTNSGSLDTTFSIGTGFNDLASGLYIQSDGKILVGGLFGTYNAVSSSRLVRLTNSGSLDTTFNVGTGLNTSVTSFAEQSDGKILIGGGFVSYNGTTRNGIARLTNSGSLDTTFSIGTGFNQGISSLSILLDGTVLTGGHSTLYNGTPIQYLAILNTDGTINNTLSSISPNSFVDSIYVE